MQEVIVFLSHLYRCPFFSIRYNKRYRANMAKRNIFLSGTHSQYGTYPSHPAKTQESVVTEQVHRLSTRKSSGSSIPAAQAPPRTALGSGDFQHISLLPSGDPGHLRPFPAPSPTTPLGTRAPPRTARPLREQPGDAVRLLDRRSAGTPAGRAGRGIWASAGRRTPAGPAEVLSIRRYYAGGRRRGCSPAALPGEPNAPGARRSAPAVAAVAPGTSRC